MTKARTFEVTLEEPGDYTMGPAARLLFTVSRSAMAKVITSRLCGIYGGAIIKVRPLPDHPEAPG